MGTGRTRRWPGNWPRKRASKVSHDSFTLTFESAVKLQDVERAIGAIRQHDVAEMRPAVDEAAIDGLKFSECLPIDSGHRDAGATAPGTGCDPANP